MVTPRSPLHSGEGRHGTPSQPPAMRLESTRLECEQRADGGVQGIGDAPQVIHADRNAPAFDAPYMGFRAAHHKRQPRLGKPLALATLTDGGS